MRAGDSIPSTIDISLPQRRIAYAAAAILLGQTIWIGRAGFSPVAMALITTAIALTAIGLFACDSPIVRRLPPGALRWLLIAGILAALARLPMIGLFVQFPRSRATLMPFVALAMIAIVLIACIQLLRSRFLTAAAFGLLVAAHFLMGAWYLGISPDPHCDVYLAQRLGCEELLQRRDPFAMTIPDIYGPTARFYPAGAVVNGQLQSGYFYPPLSLVLDVPAYLAGDVRYAHLFALSLTALLIGFTRRDDGSSGVRFAPAIIVMFTPGIFWILENAWIDPFLLLMLSATVCFASRGRFKLAAAAFGLFLVGKQYAPFTVLAVPLLLQAMRKAEPRRPATSRLALASIAAGAVVTLPFFVWNPRAFLHSLISIYVGVLRPDSNTFLPLLARTFNWHPSLALTTAVALTAGALVAWRAPRTLDGFAAGIAFILLCIFAFSTQAFGNYYFLASGALLAAIVAPAVGRDRFASDRRPMGRNATAEGAPR